MRLFQTMTTRIHVNQHIIRANKKHGKDDPAITVRFSRGAIRCRSVEINGPSRIVQSMHKPLSCGAKVWIETESDVRTFGAEI
jgi:hypothetical protein